MSICRVISWVVGRVFAMTSAISWQNSASLCPASVCTPRPNLPVTPGISWIPTFAFQFPMMKWTSYPLGVVAIKIFFFFFVLISYKERLIWSLKLSHPYLFWSQLNLGIALTRDKECYIRKTVKCDLYTLKQIINPKEIFHAKCLQKWEYYRSICWKVI